MGALVLSHVFFFKQKPAYEMRISDWSSDVCSSDLVRGNADGLTKRQLLPALTPFRARELRRHATEAEKLLWRALREAFPTAKFRRQVPLGPYFADFCSHAARLVIEVDGGQHADARDYDTARPR